MVCHFNCRVLEEFNVVVIIIVKSYIQWQCETVPYWQNDDEYIPLDPDWIIQFHQIFVLLICFVFIFHLLNFLWQYIFSSVFAVLCYFLLEVVWIILITWFALLLRILIRETWCKEAFYFWWKSDTLFEGLDLYAFHYVCLLAAIRYKTLSFAFSTPKSFVCMCEGCRQVDSWLLTVDCVHASQAHITFAGRIVFQIDWSYFGFRPHIIICFHDRIHWRKSCSAYFWLVMTRWADVIFDCIWILIGYCWLVNEGWHLQ